MAVVEIDLAALDPGGGDLRGRVERVAVGDEQRGVFAGFERADAIGDAEDLRRIERDRLQGLVGGQAKADGGGGVVGQIADVAGAEAAVRWRCKSGCPALCSSAGRA